MVTKLIGSTVLRRTGILSKFISIQLIAQVVGFASGILLIRSLAPTQYAYYTIASSMQTTMHLLADMGLGGGLLSIGGKIWQDRYRFGQLVHTAMYIRRYLSIIAMIVVTPIMVWLLVSNGASTVETVIIVVIILIEFNLELILSISHDVLRLQSKVSYFQYSQIIYSSVRLGLLGIAFFIYLNATIAIIASFISTAIQRLYLDIWLEKSLDTHAPLNEEDKKEFIRLIKAQAAYFIFFIIQGQLTVFLISLFGNTQRIAEVGALGRLGVLLSLVSSIINQIIVPGFARRHSLRQIRYYYAQTVTASLLFAIVMIMFAMRYPKVLLWILGASYSNLENEVVFILANAMFQALNGTIWSLNVAKGWVKNSWLIIPSTISVQIISVVYLDVSSVRGVIVFGIISIIPTIGVNIYMSYKGLKTV